MSTVTSEKPAYLSGRMAPVRDEIEAVDLPVDGAIPSELMGRYFRNGPNPVPGIDPGHAFAGQGMVHGIRLADGQAKWYRNRWVRTPTMDGARMWNPNGTRNLEVGLANTSVLPFGGQMLALVENSLPYSISENLVTIGAFDFSGKLKTPMTAHPKIDPRTGDLHFFGYDQQPPFVTYHVASADGRLLKSIPVEVNGPTMMHDFAITENYIVWLDMPVVFDSALATSRRGMPFRWSDEYPARIGVMPRTGQTGNVRWLNVLPGYAFHVGNAFEDRQGRMIIEAVQYDGEAFQDLWRDLGGEAVVEGEHSNMPRSGGRLYRWHLDPVRGFITEEPLDDLSIEFPAINADFVGRGNRYTYAVNTPFQAASSGGKIVKYDAVTGRRSVHELGSDWSPGEAVFVAAPGAVGEDEGWLVSIVTHATADAAKLVILDAASITKPPLATVTLPRRVPVGFHGAWIPDARAH